MHALPERLALGAGDSKPNRLLLADALVLLGTLTDGSADLAYADPPFATGQVRRGPGAEVGQHRYDDTLDDPVAYRAWLEPHLAELHRVLAPTGSLFLHLDHPRLVLQIHHDLLVLLRAFSKCQRTILSHVHIFCYSPNAIYCLEVFF